MPLPISLTSFIGRAGEIRSGIELLLEPEVRLLTLTGAGGIGKTRLAIQIASGLANSFIHGISFVPLDSIQDPNLVAAAVAAAMRLPDVPGEQLLVRMERFLAERHVLLVLDNFEHLLDATPLVHHLLTTCPFVKILCTSRTPLHLTGEHVVTVLPLSLPHFTDSTAQVDALQSEAVQLFIERARASSSGFMCLPEDIPEVSEICLQLDGLPLAIELAAGRVSVLPLRALRARLKLRHNLLIDGPTDAPVRQRTMRDSIEWSYDLLNATEQRLYRRLGAFVGGCFIKALEDVAVALGDSPEDVFTGVASLLQHNLLRHDGAACLNPRYDMLQTVREDAFERLSASGEVDGVRNCHAAYLVDLSELRQLGMPEEEWLGLIEPEQENIRTILTWAIERREVDIAQRLVGSIWLHFWAIRGHFREGRIWAERVRAFGPGSSPEAFEEVLFAASEFASSCGDFGDAVALAEDAVAAAELSGNPSRKGMALHHLAMAVGQRDGLAQGESMFERARELLTGARCFRERRTAAAVTHNLAVVIGGRGDLERAEALAEEALGYWKELSSTWGTVGTLTTLASIALERGNPARSRALGKQALKLAWRLQAQVLTADALRMAAGTTPTGRDHAELVVHVWSAADALTGNLGLVLPEEERAYQDASLAEVRLALGSEAFAAHWAIGRGMPLQQVVDEVIASIPSSSLEERVNKLSVVKCVDNDCLTPRELQILRHIAEHKTDQEIADELTISRRTVNAHVAHILAKLKVPTRRSAVTRAQEENILSRIDNVRPYT